MTKYRVFIRGFEDFHSKALPKPSMFIAHDFTASGKAETNADIPRQIEGYRHYYEKGLAKVGYIPVYAPIYSGTILETLCEEMISTNAGIFDVSFGRQYNANVMIELGISLGINHPTIVVADEKHKPILDFLAPLNPMYYRDSYDLRDKIGVAVKEQIETFQKAINFCVICNQPHCSCRKELFPHDKHYSLVGLDDFPNIQIDIEDAVEDLKLEKLTLQSDGHHTQLCTWLYHLRKSRLALFYSQELGKRHHGAENAMTMVQLGMAIGTGVPWRIILKEGEIPPTDATGYIHVEITSSAPSNIDHLKGAISFLKSIVRPFAGREDVLQTPEYLDEETILSIDEPTTPTGLPQAPFINVPPMPDNFVLDEAELSRVKNLLLANPSETIVLDGIAGIGKTTLATAVCYESDVREYFDLGICWLNANKEISQIIDEIDAIRHQIFDDVDKTSIADITSLDDLRLAVESLKNNFKKKSPNSRILFVIDDVRDRQVAQALSALATPQSAVLFTTRDSDILASQETDAPQPSDDDYWFVSYARQDDSEFTTRLVNDLGNAGIRIWHDTNFHEVHARSAEIDEALSNATGMIFVMTESSLKSQFVMIEVYRMLQLGKLIFPIIVSGISPDKIPIPLKMVQYTNMSGDYYQAGLPRLITAIQEYSIKATLEDIRQSKQETVDKPRIFIAYRRTNAFPARAVFEYLRKEGFDCFLDIEGIEAGDSFENIIMNQIRERDIIIVIITPSALERTQNPEDWLRRELEEALRLKKTIVPLMSDGFTWANDKLPESLSDLQRLNSLSVPAAYFDEAMKRLIDRFLMMPN